MLNFEVINPTRIVFGKDQLDRLPALLEEIAPNKKVLIAYGGSSAQRIGLLEKIREKLNGFHLTEFGGIEANPEYTTLMKGVQFARDKKVEAILAVGGGSVIDGVKFMSGAFYYKGNPWDVLLRKEGCMFEKALPFGTVLTLPATGSEANSGAVVSRSELNEKRAMGGPLFFPKFSFLDPTVVASLPERQIANGIVDAFVHTLEQYVTYPTDNFLQERQAEAILSTLIEIGPKVIKNPDDYVLASNLMWCATHALNGNLRCGVPTDWATHMIGHELTAFYGIDHARTLAIIGPRLYEDQFENKKQKLAQYGKRVWNLTGSEDECARMAIQKTEAFFQSLGIQTHVSDYTDQLDDLPVKIRSRFEERGWVAMGERQAITPERVESIVKAAL
ncbi:MAG: iron-containing alcohol dehydrogenase [Cryomorphaceae bacterium]|jgi:NADP-dependent alcohol dehydrogenase|nr:iron-containing alcohol dehydrogenase [Cryomorphaceae bacterium]